MSCWNAFCIAGDCDGVNHVDATGYTWKEREKPCGGDAVRLAAPWNWGGLEIGEVGVLQGPTDKPVDGGSIIFRHSTFRDDKCASSSGGPGTIWTDASELRRTGETVELNVWKWKAGMLPGRDAGEYYRVTVPVWDWYPANR